MTDPSPRTIVEQWYKALAAGDVNTVISTFHSELKASVIGTTPVSGRYEGRDAFIAGTLGVVFAALDPERARFAQTWKVFAAEGDRVAGLMAGNATTKSGVPYNSVYCQLFTIADGQIAEYLEFVDTALVESAIFDNPLSNPPSALPRPAMTIDSEE
jgi:uncharacterized protein